MLLKNCRIYGYLRVSEKEAKENKCRKRLEKFIINNHLEVDEIVEEIISGSVLAANRKGLSRLLEILRNDDILIVYRLLDLGRYYSNTEETLVLLHDKGVRLCILDLPYFDEWQAVQDKKTYEVIFELLHTLLKEAVCLEKQNISLNTQLGMAKAIEAGKVVGHPKTKVPESFKKRYRGYKSGVYGGMCLMDFCKMNGISKTCYYNWEKKMKDDGEI